MQSNNITPLAGNNQPSISNLFQLHPQASPKDVAAHSYNLAKQVENILIQLSELTACTDSLPSKADEIGWFLMTLEGINSQQIICSEHLDDSLTVKPVLEVAA